MALQNIKTLENSASDLIFHLLNASYTKETAIFPECLHRATTGRLKSNRKAFLMENPLARGFSRPITDHKYETFFYATSVRF